MLTAIGQIGYVVLTLFVYAGWLVLTWRFARYLRQPSLVDTLDGTMPKLSWPDLAYLAGGKLQVFQASLVWLVQQGVLEYGQKTRVLRVLKNLPNGAPEPCMQLYRLVQRGSNGQVQVDTIRNLVGDCRDRLIEQGVSYHEGRWVGLLTFAVLQFPLSMVPFGVMLFGSQLLFGLRDNARVVALIAFVGGGVILLYSFCLLVHLCTKRHASIWGEHVLKDNLKSIWPNRPYFYTFYAPPPELQHNLALAVAAFGETTIWKTDLEYLSGAMTDPQTGGE